MLITKTLHPKQNCNTAIIAEKPEQIQLLTHDESLYIQSQYHPSKKDLFYFNRLTHHLIVYICPLENESNTNTLSKNRTQEKIRKAGDKISTFCEKEEIKTLTIQGTDIESESMLLLTEGIALGAYGFKKYKSDKKGEETLNSIEIYHTEIQENTILELQNIVEATYFCRDLVNEPPNIMHVQEFCDRVLEQGKNTGLHIAIMDKEQISRQNMQGLLTVNKGSILPPAFCIMEWNPNENSDSKPIVLVGKGLLFDTGGINLKPGGALDAMKSDMAGGAAVAATLIAAAKNTLPFHIIGLIPLTDNRPGEDAMVPGDIITYSNQKSVEIINTDAEGRLILADALIYAKKYNPELVIDVATLTGAAAMAVGRFALVGMQQNADSFMQKLKESSMRVNERIAEMPFWEDYDAEVLSDIADIRNIGKGRGAGAITAGKFLAHFVDYPWIHLDIASMAFMDTRESYFGQGASGVGVRLMYDFLKSKQ